VSSKVQELQAQHEMEKQEKAELRLEMDSLKLQAQESESTMTKQSHEVDRLKDTIKSQAQQSEAAMAKQSEEIESLKKTVQDCSWFLRQMITFQGQVPPPWTACQCGSHPSNGALLLFVTSLNLHLVRSAATTIFFL